MRPPDARPVGITLIAIVLATNGIASLVEAVAAAGPTVSAVITAGLSGLIGLLLLHRAYGIFNLKRGAWLATVILLCLRGVMTSVHLIRGSSGVLTWIDLAVFACTVLYLLHPRVRSVFSRPHNPLAFK